MMITLNGVAERLDMESTTIRGLLKAKGWSFPLIVAKVNGVLVARDAWDDAVVVDGDTIEAAHLMSGG